MNVTTDTKNDAGMTATPEEIVWRKREPMDKDPWFEAEHEGIRMHVSVECEWIWGWELDDGQNADLARGSVYIEHPDEEEDLWNYQGAEAAQNVCVAVAKLLAAYSRKAGG